MAIAAASLQLDGADLVWRLRGAWGSMMLKRSSLFAARHIRRNRVVLLRDLAVQKSHSARRYLAAPKCEFRNQFPLLPFYSANGLRRQVVADAADARNFGGNACSDVLQQRPVKLGNFSGHNINGADAANDVGRLLGSMQSSFEFGWNASLLARRILHIC